MLSNGCFEGVSIRQLPWDFLYLESIHRFLRPFFLSVNLFLRSGKSHPLKLRSFCGKRGCQIQYSTVWCPISLCCLPPGQWSLWHGGFSWTVRKSARKVHRTWNNLGTRSGMSSLSFTYQHLMAGDWQCTISWSMRNSDRFAFHMWVNRPGYRGIIISFFVGFICHECRSGRLMTF